VAHEDVDVVLDQFAAVNERDFPRAMGHYAEGVELFVDPGAFLSGGEFKGREAVGQWFADWFATFEPGYHFDVEEAREVGDRILLVASHSGRGRSSGVDVEGQTAYIYGVREGKVVRAALYGSREDALRSIGVQEQAAEE
jgi:ketosteroid isomerase-like protein